MTSCLAVRRAWQTPPAKGVPVTAKRADVLLRVPPWRRLADVSARNPQSSELLAGVFLVAGAAVEVAVDGALVVIGFATLGALLGAWAAVYDDVLCKERPFNSHLVMSWAVRGAVALPGIAALHLVLGMAVWVAITAAALGWAVAASIRVDSPHRSS